MEAPTELWDATQAAAFLGYSRNQLYVLCRQERIPHIRIGGVVRFDPGVLRAWLAENTHGPAVVAV